MTKYNLIVEIFLIKLMENVIKILFQSNKYYNEDNQKTKNILVIGGTSGLGLAIALNLQSHKHNITIAARNLENLEEISSIHNFNYIVLDICRDIKINLDYDIIFCCAGRASTGFLEKVSMKDFEKDMKINFFGPVNLIKSILRQKNTGKNLSVFFISSTSTCLPIPGFIAYSPSKIALEEFLKITNIEMKFKKIFVHIFYSNTIKTKGFEKENINKPKITKFFENLSQSNWSPDLRAKKIIRNYKKILSFSDTLTYLLKISRGVENKIDLIFVFFGGIVQLVCLNGILFFMNKFLD